MTLLTFSNDADGTYRKFFFLLGFSASAWLAVCIHIRFKNAYATSTTLVTGIILMLVAFGIVQPTQILELLNKLRT